ncbi:unnamed protein product [Vitrella brassicaformis CCMP3155]|uniref:Uncharacterized protein n=1 Tax=Vitrella brassicaformis (strain CCMP3155) TaxID=1169540 RepID=A0A0G4EM81_VITBC|nr:unnamed protein product [Vitrella brassicaformis CCMP3155]|eukprot:CEL98047.1 unnamed protein product [Vitrella brassicaformis CCMP3155]
MRIVNRPIIRHRGTSLEMQFGFGSKENEEQKQKRFEMQQEILRKRREGDPLKSKYKPKEAAEGMPGKSEGGSVNYQIGTSFKSQPGGEDDGWVLVKGKWRYYPQNVKEGGGESGAAQGKKEEKKKTGPFGLW